MTKLKTILVDDEPLARSLLRAKLNKISGIEIIAECKNGREAIEQIISLSPDLVFLDIQMPGIDGFGVIQNLQVELMPLVVFVTAYDQYALDAFDVYAIDYILKPIEDEKIHRAVTRAKERIKNSEHSIDKSGVISAIDQIKNNKVNTFHSQTKKPATDPAFLNDGKVVIKDREEIIILKQSDIQWVDAAGDYVCIHSAGITHIKRSTLKSLLNELNPTIFKQVHRSTIVNLNYVKKVIPHTKGEFFLKLGDFDKVKVSRNYRDVIKQFLQSN